MDYHPSFGEPIELVANRSEISQISLRLGMGDGKANISQIKDVRNMFYENYWKTGKFTIQILGIHFTEPGP
jgi:hypothetical protein